MRLLIAGLKNNAMEHGENKYEQKITCHSSPNSANDITNDRIELHNKNNSLGKDKIDIYMISGNDKKQKKYGKKVQFRRDNSVNSSTKSFDTNTDIIDILMMDSSIVKHATNYQIKWRTAEFLMCIKKVGSKTL